MIIDTDADNRDGVPDADDLATVLALVVASTRTAEEIRDNSGVPWTDVQASIMYLRGQKVIRDIGGARYHAAQTICAGFCGRRGRDLGGQPIVIDPKTLTWACEPCWVAASVSGAHPEAP